MVRVSKLSPGLTLPLVVALAAALSGCSVATEGAPCSTTDSCPAGQGCGADHHCSQRALGCTRCVAGEARCGAGGLETCVAASDGVCASFGQAVAPPPHQTCDGSTPGHAAFVCAPTVCKQPGTVCTGAAEIATCAVDQATQCLFDARDPCLTGEVCAGDANAKACSCPAESSGVAGLGCATQTLNATTCDGASGNVVACRAVGACRVWQVSQDCASAGLVCGPNSGPAACECPANAGSDFYADPVAGSPRGSFPFPKGSANPPQCRFKKLGDALSAAAAPARVIATGFAGAEVVFSGEALPLDVQAGVSLTTSDPAPVPAHYVVLGDQQRAASVIHLREGATLAGFTVRNAITSAAISAGVATACTGATPPISIRGLVVDGAGTGTNPFVNAMTVSGDCDLTVSDGTFTGASGSGVLVTDPTTVATFHHGVFQGNGLSGLDVQGGAKVVVDGSSAFTSNQEHGLALRSGEAVVTGTSAVPIEFAQNVSDGILAGVDQNACKLSLTNASVHDNANGVEVVNNDSNGVGHQMLFQSSTFANNNGAGGTQGAGILVKKSTADASSAAPTSIMGCTFSGNAKHGVWINSGGGDTFVHVEGNTVTGSGDWGVVVNATANSKLDLLGNAISGNGGKPIASRAGGLLFTGLQPTLTFHANVMKSNKGDQVGVGNTVGNWSLDGGPVAGECPVTANTFACYDVGGVGLLAFGTGPPEVTASANAWANPTPAPGLDFRATTGNIAPPSTSCSAVTACP